MNKRKKINEFVCFKMCFSVSPIMTILMLLNTVILMAIPLINIYAAASFINSSIDFVIKGIPKSRLVIPIIVIVFATGYSQFDNIISSIISIKIVSKLRKKYGIMRMKKMASLTYFNIENSDSMDLIRRTENDGQDIMDTAKTLLNTLVIFSQIVSVYIAIMTSSVLVAIIALAITIPLVKIAIWAGHQEYYLEQEVSNLKRKFEYYDGIQINRDSVDERTVFRYGSFAEKKMLDSYEEFRKKDNLCAIRNNVFVESGSIAASFLTIIIASLLLFPFYKNQISLGLLLSIFTALMGLTDTMSFGFKDTISKVANNHEKLKDINAFFDLPEENEVLNERADNRYNAEKRVESIEFKHVFFKYPNTDTYILKDLSLRINAGKHYAFVGKNGAGKSTIIKLLTGLYRDYEGEILINGKELRDYGLDELRDIWAIVYQDFAKYQISLHDNIMLGDWGCPEERIEEVINACGLKEVVQKIGGDINTPLGKIVDNGVDLSGGEWQKIAIARAFVKNSNALILDEPTAALDPMMESKLYEQFFSICQNKTTVFISHRLGSTKLADIIFVIDDGMVEESGSHNELMSNERLYEKMYNSQREWYEQ